mgnify:CR=1 FL=1
MENRHRTYQRQSMGLVFFLFVLVLLTLLGRLFYLMIGKADYYGVQAKELHERERKIKAERGEIKDCHGNVLAANRSVSTISVIHSQMKEPERVITLLSKELMLDEKEVRKKVEKVSLREKIKSNVDKETSDRIRNYKLAGVTVDEDYKREYRYDSLASKVLGFTGGDNQGIIGLEVSYEKYLKGLDGSILTMTTAYGTEIENGAEDRIEPVAGWTLNTSLDLPVMEYTDQLANYLLKKKQAKSVDIIVMNPQNGEILAMVNEPEFNLNEPFTLNTEIDTELSEEEKQDALNKMWRNQCINDTYEPGSTFKIITASAALEEGKVSLSDQFNCPGYKIVEDRRIRCHKVGGHGAEDFTHGIMNSCNPVFIEIGLRIGSDRFCDYFEQFGLLSRTNIDLPGEASTIMHKKENIGQVELATMSFGQSFQITPIQLATTVSSIINGGNRVTPHFGVETKNAEGEVTHTFVYGQKEHIVSEETSTTMRYLLEKVVSEGSGKNAALEGFSIGGKTATSQTLPRSEKRYISSFLGFAPADDPQVLALIIINNPQGVYYGGTIAAPVCRDLFSNILPYLGIEQALVTEDAEIQENP